MHTQNRLLVSRHDVQPLEPRRLLSVAPFAPETAVPVEGEVTSVDVAIADNGSFLVTSLVKTAADAWSLLAVRYSATGEQLGEPLTVFSGSGVEGHSVSMDADGDAVVAYASAGDVHVRRISKTGALGAPLLVATPRTSPDRYDTAVSMDAAGGFFVAWTTNFVGDYVLVPPTVQMRAYGPDDQPRGPEFVAATFHTIGGDPTFNDLVIAANPDGSGAVFAFENDRLSGAYITRINFGRAGTSGPIGETVEIKPDRVGNIHPPDNNNPSVAVRADGSFVIGYDVTTAFETEFLGSLAERYSAAGELQGGRIDVAEGLRGGDDVGAVQVVDLPDGGFIASVVRTDDDVSTLYARRYDASGAPADAAPTRVAVVDWPAHQRAARLSADADASGHAVVAFVNAGAPYYRRLTSGVAAIDKSTLYVLGTESGDSLGLRTEGASLVARRGATTQSFNPAGVSSVFIEGFGGDDTIVNDAALPSTTLGGTGDDKILGGSGTDSLSGGDGKDKLFGREGKDSLSGNAGNDTLEGGPRADRVAGNGGRDRLYGGSGNDRLFGGAQADSLFGGGGEDQLNGESGNDRLYGEDAGDDTLYGGTGNDVLFARDALLDHLFGGPGDDSGVADDEDLLGGVESLL